MPYRSKQPLLSSRAWTSIIIALWIGLITAAQAQSVWRDRVSASQWFVVRSVRVLDALEGTCPRMEVDRSIHRPFLGEFVATVFRKTEDGYEVYPPGGGGPAAYSPAAVIPKGVTLAWWMNWTDCKTLRRGRYMLRTVWVIRVEGFPPKYVLAQSNDFTILEPVLVRPIAPAEVSGRAP